MSRNSLAYKIRYGLYRFKFNHNFLTHLDIELNNTCNHKCIMCWHSGELNFDLKVMKVDQAFDILKAGRKLGMKSVKLNLRGEPTLYKHLPVVIREAKRLDYIDTMINTHGVFLRDRYQEIKEAGIDTIIVSIGSTDRDAYAKVHQVPVTDFDKLHEGLRLIHDDNSGILVKLNCHFSIVSNFDFDLLKAEYPRFVVVKRFIEEREGTNISIKREKVRKKKCPHMHRRLTVQSNGDVYPCCMSFNSPKDIRCGNFFADGGFGNSNNNRKILIDRYSKKDFPDSCKACPSGDVYKFGKVEI